MKKNCSKTTQGLQTYLVPEWGVFFAAWVSTTSCWASLLLFASWSGLKKLWAVACKSILRASPRAYWNSRGVVTRPSGRDDHQRWCFGWEIQGGNSGSPLKSLDVSWLSFHSLHTTSHLFFMFNLKISNLWEQFLLQKERSCQVNADSRAGAGWHQ